MDKKKLTKEEFLRWKVEQLRRVYECYTLYTAYCYRELNQNPNVNELLTPKIKE